MPPDLPEIIYYRMACCQQFRRGRGHDKKCKRPTDFIVLTGLPRRPVQSIASSGVTNASTVRPNVPSGAFAFRDHPEGEWKPIDQLPKAWLPFLNRS